jgi:TRAP-type mannitol/chloroaromatic compound transport system substrate-binding protein
MKRKIVMLFLSLVVVFSLVIVGCAAEEAAPPEEGAPPPEEEEEEAPPAAPEAETFEWTAQAIWPAGFSSYVDSEEVLRRINVASGGRLNIKLVPAGAIVPAYEILDAVASGAVDAEVSGISAEFGKFATAMFFDKYPAGPSAWEEYVWLYKGGGMELWQELYDMNGINVHVVGPMGASSAESFGWFPKPITSLDDFKGLKFRTQGIWGDVLTELGCSVVTMPGGEVYEAAQRGVIDAFEYSTPSVNWSAGFHELRPVCMEPGMHAPMSLFDFKVNGDRWNELPDDLKQIVEIGCQAGAVYMLASADYDDLAGFENMVDYGVQFVRLPEEVQLEIVRISNEIWDEMAKDDPFFAEVLQSQRDFLKKYRSLMGYKQPDPALMEWPQK